MRAKIVFKVHVFIVLCVLLVFVHSAFSGTPHLKKSLSGFDGVQVLFMNVPESIVALDVQEGSKFVQQRLQIAGIRTIDDGFVFAGKTDSIQSPNMRKAYLVVSVAPFPMASLEKNRVDLRVAGYDQLDSNLTPDPAHLVWIAGTVAPETREEFLATLKNLIDEFVKDYHLATQRP